MYLCCHDFLILLIEEYTFQSYLFREFRYRFFLPEQGQINNFPTNS